MSRKLGRADLIAMQSDDELGTASLSRLAIGVSYTKDDAEGRPRFERLFMMGIAFMPHPHNAHVFDADYHERMSVLPPHERRYRSLGWTSIGSFSGAVQSRGRNHTCPLRYRTQCSNSVCPRPMLGYDVVAYRHSGSILASR